MTFLEPTFLIFLITCVSIVYPLTGSNVCTTQSLVPSTSVHSSSALDLNCEELGFTIAACQAARNGRISFSELYLTTTTNSCCDGWIQEGDICSPCPTGRYGRNCSLSCQCLNDGTCDHLTGECSCTVGWTGNHCEERCTTATYSSNCTLQCLTVCANGGVCHPSNGHCLCDYGWEGDSCNIGCVGKRCYMESDSCSNGASYDPTGHCFCAPGWQGRYCTEPCPSNRHGTFCDEVCQCENDGLCSWEDGSCLCQQGYSGMFCENPCEEGFFGQDCDLRCNCPMVGGCDAVGGACLTCPIGYYGPRCTEHCPPSFWGLSCSQPCNCLDQSACDPYTGECPGQGAPEPSPTTTGMTGMHPAAVTTTTSPMPSTLVSRSYAVPSDKGSPPMTSFIIPLIVCILLALVVGLLVVIALKHPCRRKSTIGAEGVVKLTHHYAECNGGKEESDYAEIVDINGGYEVPMLDELDKPSSSTSTGKPQCEVNYYQAPPVRAPSNDVTTPDPVTSNKIDNNGYLHLNESRSPPPEYQTIITKNQWNLK
ncbi:multiple epidermal growth factor-like domains protein 11 [Strongylocentrotus purpuratus]|uniref:EGF-like domain-containing protein n=1 Tax=Strongylocentrotus purpuratus TaxID=7668 RepID=A0A7M7ST38_STRPU|nr:multiple epidermal growth factor-like domains protein 11 [Strongylocentrotus purpuratus]